MTFGYKFYDYMPNIYDPGKKVMTKTKRFLKLQIILFMISSHTICDLRSYNCQKMI